MKHEQFEHGPLLEAWLKEPTWLPDTDLPRVSALVHQTPQRHSWLPRPGLARSRLMLSATSIVAGVAAIALTGGVLLNGLAPAPPTEPMPAAATETATTEAPSEAVLETTTTEDGQEVPPTNVDTPHITLPDLLPDGVTGGAIDTADGPARWAQMTANTGVAPRPGTVLPWGDGLAVWETQTKLPDGGVGRLWTTNDGVSWRPEALPQDLRKRPSSDGSMWMKHRSGTYYLHEPSTGKLWRRDEDGAWVRLDTSAVAEARPGGWFASGPYFTGPDMVDGELVFRASYLYHLPRKTLGIPGGPETRYMHHLEKDRYALCPPDNRECSAKEAAVVVRFKATGEGLVVRDDRTGERYGLLKGAKPSEPYEGNDHRRGHAFELDGDTLIPVDAPRTRASSTKEPAPPGLPLKVQPIPLDPGWIGVEWPYEGRQRGLGEPGYEPGSWWMHLAEEWVDLAEFGFPDLIPYVTPFDQAGLGNTTLLWFDDPEDEMSSLWVVTAPDGG